MRGLLTTIRLSRFLPLLLAARRSPCWDSIRLDLWRASQWGFAHRSSGDLTIREALSVLDERPVRSVVLSRLARAGGSSGLAATVLKRLCPGEPTLEIGCDAGAGLRIAHGYGTLVHAATIGTRCTLYQGVTLGHTDHGAPFIGDRVRIYGNAQVLGPVTIGDDAVVAAGAVVISDVPAGMMAAGVPARVVKPARPPLHE